jgi:hypothetical protein
MSDEQSSTSNEQRITRLETNLKNLVRTVSTLAESVQEDSASMRSSIDRLSTGVTEARKLSWRLIFTILGTLLTSIAMMSGFMLFWVRQSLQPVQAEIEKVKIMSDLNDKIISLQLDKKISKTLKYSEK